MRLKKVTALLVVSVFLIGLLSGCSTAEIGYLNLAKEMNSLKVYQGSGEIVFNIDKLPQEFQGDVKTGAAIAFLKDNIIKYDLRANYNKDLIDCNFKIKNTTTGQEKEITGIVIKGDMVYLKVDQLARLLEGFGIPDLKEAVGDAKYIGVSMEDLNENSEAAGVDSPLFTSNYLEKQPKLSLKLFDVLVNGYEHFESGVVKQDGNRFVITFDADKLVKLLQSFTEYTIENSDKISAVATNLLEGLDNDEMAILSLDPAKKAEYLQKIDEANREIKSNKQDLVFDQQKLDEFLNSPEYNALKGSNCEISLQKTGKGTYQSDSLLSISYTPEEMKDHFKGQLRITQIMKVIKDFDVNIAEQDVISLDELEKMSSDSLEVDINNNTYTLEKAMNNQQNSGKIDVQIVDNRTYLPLRQVGESFGETVGWDAGKQQAYIDRDGQQIVMSGLIVDGRTFVKVRDFEKLGYDIGWNGESCKVSIVK